MNRLCAFAAAAAIAALPTITAAQKFGDWGAPASIEAVWPYADDSINTPVLEGCPAISRDGLTLYFASNRVYDQNPSATIDIWRSTRSTVNDAWGEPSPLSGIVNRPGSNEFCPTPMRNGKGLLFISNKAGGCGAGDIYVTVEDVNGEWSEPDHLPCTVNSSAEEASPFLVEYDDGVSELYFSSNRAGGFSTATPDTDWDIYVSRLHTDGSFGTPQLAAGVNTVKDDVRPNLRRDGLEMFFDSNRDGSLLNAAGTATSQDIWTATRKSRTDAWSNVQNVYPVNSPATESRAYVSWDGLQLFFGTTRDGSSDLYVSTRLKNH